LLIKYKCNLCDNSIKKIYNPKKDKIPGFLYCECSGVMEKELPDISTTSVEVVDTGTMVRKVELRKDAAKMAREKGDIYIKNMENRERILKKDEN
jgi:hypothetical protein